MARRKEDETEWNQDECASKGNATQTQMRNEARASMVLVWMNKVGNQWKLGREEEQEHTFRLVDPAAEEKSSQRHRTRWRTVELLNYPQDYLRDVRCHFLFATNVNKSTNFFP